jgi:hypothetical protein
MASVESGSRQPSKAEQEWRNRIAQWRASGQSVRAFCAERQLSEPSFYSWRRTITSRDDAATPVPKPITTDRPESADRPAFVPVRVVAASPTSGSAAGGLELILSAGHVVRITPGFDSATLRRLLAALEEPVSC